MIVTAGVACNRGMIVMASDPEAIEPGRIDRLGAGSLPGRHWRAAEVWNLSLRILLLVVLVAGMVAAAMPRHATHRQEDDLVGQLGAGRVSYVEYDRSTRRILWTDNWWSFQEATLVSWPGRPQDASDPESGLPPGQGAQAWLQQQVAASPHPVQFAEPGSRQSARWENGIRWSPLLAAVKLAELLAFLLMFARPDHRYANRWAWFWVLLIAPVGTPLYLVLEPFPIWRKPWQPGPAGRRLRGGAGLLWGILLNILTGVAVAVLDALL